MSFSEMPTEQKRVILGELASFSEEIEAALREAGEPRNEDEISEGISSLQQEGAIGAGDPFIQFVLTVLAHVIALELYRIRIEKLKKEDVNGISATQRSSLEPFLEKMKEIVKKVLQRIRGEE